jgi:hypothetical protein
MKGWKISNSKKVLNRRKWLKIPIDIVHEMLQSKSVYPLEQYLEGMELASNAELVDSLIEAKKDLEAGKGISWEEIKEKYGIA